MWLSIFSSLSPDGALQERRDGTCLPSNMIGQCVVQYTYFLKEYRKDSFWGDHATLVSDFGFKCKRQSHSERRLTLWCSPSSTQQVCLSPSGPEVLPEAMGIGSYGQAQPRSVTDGNLQTTGREPEQTYSCFAFLILAAIPGDICFLLRRCQETRAYITSITLWTHLYWFSFLRVALSKLHRKCFLCVPT